MFRMVLFLRNKRFSAKRKRGWAAAWLTTLFAALVLNAGVAAAHRTILQQGIAEEVVRFHVLANSDSDRDQEIKYMVRDEVLRRMQEEMRTAEKRRVGERQTRKGEADAGKGAEEVKMQAEEKSADLSEKEAAEQFLRAHLKEIEAAANRVLAEQGVSYRAEASLEQCYFPDRTYGDCTFPAGWYEALRIRLGEARGHNWWCVLYPALCFSDCLHAAVCEDGMAELKETLSAEEYESLLRKPGEWKISFRWF